MRLHRLIFALAITLGLTGFARDRLDLWVDATVLPPLLSETSVEVRDRNGQMLRAYTVAEGRWRLAVTPAQVDPAFTRMLIAYEDKRFATHSGVDLRAILRAGLQAAWNGQVISGGSTLTMQVARLLENSGTGRWKGKIRQIRVALALERTLTKDQIMGLYLTRAPYGGNIEGIRAATLTWFGKEPRRMTPAEAALLVALPQSPEGRRPDRNRAAARNARDRVLTRMVSAKILNQDTSDSAILDPIPAQRRPFPALAPHMSDRARSARPLALRHDLTLDATLQAKLETLATTALLGLPETVSVAMIIADHRTGEVLGSVGSAGFTGQDPRQGYVDMTRAVRSPGSTLKPLIYAMAFDRGLAQPQTLIDDRPTAFGNYVPRNFDGTFRGELTITQALRQSLNIPVVLLLDEIGPAHLMDAMRRIGMSPKLPGAQPGLAVALGGVGLTLQDLVQLYATLAQGGQATALKWMLSDTPQIRDQVVSRSSAWQVGQILAGLTPPPGAPRGALAYKTGTSYGYRDAWAIGFDGRHVAGVWIGRPDGTPVPGAFGGDLAAPILFEAFQRLKYAPDPLPAPPPETLILSTAELPQPLRRFTGRNAPFEPEADAPKLIFPPDGARLALRGGALPVKVRDGTPPFTWIANGRPLVTGSRQRQADLAGLSVGYSQVSVIDALGRAARITVQLD